MISPLRKEWIAHIRAEHPRPGLEAQQLPITLVKPTDNCNVCAELDFLTMLDDELEIESKKD